MNLWWVSWTLLGAALLGGGAWLGLGIWWWSRKKSRRRANSPAQIEKQPVQNQFIEKFVSVESPSQPSPENDTPTNSEGLTTKQSSSSPENVMWRPPPRESLLHRQQVKTKLAKPADRIESSRAHRASQLRSNFSSFPATEPSLRSNLPPFPTAEPISPPQPANSASTKLIKPKPFDSKIGRQRQGLESLVNVAPHVESVSNHGQEPLDSTGSMGFHAEDL
ncbi:hypothetical protein CCP3SC5AM1_1420005 [Gammaproteobacteria bacterium]